MTSTTRLDALGLRQQVIARLRDVHRRLVKYLRQHEVVEVEYFGELLAEVRGVEQVRHAHCAPRRLVLVGRTDAATGGTDLVGAALEFARLVQRHMRGQISGQPAEMRNRSNTGTPRSISTCRSLNSAGSDSTTPLPM